VTELNRITQKPKVMGGKPCIRGMRGTVGMIVGQIGAGRSIEEVLADYPYLEREGVLQALRYAAWRAEEREHIEAVHWSEGGPVGAEDTEIMAYAAQHDCLVSTSARFLPQRRAQSQA
jgi:uncharacterized protein (DUF433 family)